MDAVALEAVSSTKKKPKKETLKCTKLKKISSGSLA